MGLPIECKLKLDDRYAKGRRNLITDVPGVKVGQITLNDGERDIHTGVTAIFPHSGNLFKQKVAGGVSVINGFGKSAGLIQIEELGNIETPIIMTNTFGVGTALNALTKYMLEQNEDIGAPTCTVNCVVTECNDGELNDIRGMHVTEADVRSALDAAGPDFEEGAVGGGTGMICMGKKGGIGSSSRIVEFDGKKYTIGSIVMSNFGVLGNLRINGERISVDIDDKARDKGSIIMVIGTDLPLSDRQLRRMAKRATVSLGRVGSYLGTGSGDIAIAFSNGNIVPHYSEEKLINCRYLFENDMDTVFEATAETVEEAIISSLYHADGMTGIRGKTVHGLKEYL